MKLWTILVVLQCLTVCFGVVSCRPSRPRVNMRGGNKRTRAARVSRRPSKITATQRARRRLAAGDAEPELGGHHVHKNIRQIAAENVRLRPTVHSDSRSRQWSIGMENLIPEVECPTAEDGLKLLACPSPSIGRRGQEHYQCIDDHALCDGIAHCPNGEDEDRTVCMFHKVTMNYFKLMMNALTAISRSQSIV